MKRICILKTLNGSFNHPSAPASIVAGCNRISHTRLAMCYTFFSKSLDERHSSLQLQVFTTRISANITNKNFSIHVIAITESTKSFLKKISTISYYYIKLLFAKLNSFFTPFSVSFYLCTYEEFYFYKHSD